MSQEWFCILKHNRQWRSKRAERQAGCAGGNKTLLSMEVYPALWRHKALGMLKVVSFPRHGLGEKRFQTGWHTSTHLYRSYFNRSWQPPVNASVIRHCKVSAMECYRVFESFGRGLNLIDPVATSIIQQTKHLLQIFSWQYQAKKKNQKQGSMIGLLQLPPVTSPAFAGCLVSHS